MSILFSNQLHTIQHDIVYKNFSICVIHLQINYQKRLYIITQCFQKLFLGGAYEKRFELQIENVDP